MKILQLVGHIVFWVLWPFFFLILRKTMRTRVLLVAGKNALVVRTWLSDGKWTLPGGGVHRGEGLKASALRELYEETGITIDRNVIRSNGRVDYKKHGISFRIARFSGKVKKPLPIRKQWHEIAHAAWMPLKQLNATNTDQAVLEHIAAWQAKK